MFFPSTSTSSPQHHGRRRVGLGAPSSRGLLRFAARPLPLASGGGFLHAPLGRPPATALVPTPRIRSVVL
ncbi:hypothetical protein ABZP36_027656 [Zizania latifolia]